ncbi:MAG: PspC domain-containing protein [Vicinamibacteria bacterium]
MPKRLVRDKQRGVIGGVAAGFGRYLDVDPVLVRVAFVLLAFANGLGILAYLVSWVLIPRAPEDEAAPAASSSEGTPAPLAEVMDQASQFAAEVRQAAPGVENVQAGVGAFLILIGAVILADNLGWLRWPHWANVETLWPLALVGLGAGLMLKSRRTHSASA